MAEIATDCAPEASVSTFGCIQAYNITRGTFVENCLLVTPRVRRLRREWAPNFATFCNCIDRIVISGLARRGIKI